MFSVRQSSLALVVILNYQRWAEDEMTQLLVSERYLVKAVHVNSLVLDAIADWLELAGPAMNPEWLEGNANFLEQGASVNYPVQVDYVNCLEAGVPVGTY